jgi:hypothetical protein
VGATASGSCLSWYTYEPRLLWATLASIRCSNCSHISGIYKFVSHNFSAPGLSTNPPAATACIQSPLHNSTVPFPLSDSTTTVLNQTTTSQPSKRKRVNANSSSDSRPAKKRPRASVAAGVATAAPPITTSCIVGVGPSEPPPSAPESEATSVVVNPTYAAIEKALKASSSTNRRDAAFDVWFFVKPLQTDNEPLDLAQPTDNVEVPLIRQKPDAPFLGCRLCRCG